LVEVSWWWKFGNAMLKQYSPKYAAGIKNPRFSQNAKLEIKVPTPSPRSRGPHLDQTT